MTSLGQTIAHLASAGDGYLFMVPDAWAQGRTLFGGMTAALCHEVALRAYPDLGPLRAAQFTFAGPATGDLRFRPRLLRRGRSAAIVAVEVLGADGNAATASLIFGTARESAVSHDSLVMPAVPPPDDCPALHRTLKPLPGYLARFEYRHAAGALLFEPGSMPAFAVWTRFREPPGCGPVTALLALADALPCAAMTVFPKPAAVSTMSWGIDLHRHPAGLVGWHLLTSASETAEDGYSVQSMRVFGPAGEGLATGRQMVALYI